MHQDLLPEEALTRIIQELQINTEELDQILADPINDRLLGSFFGASIGDSLGSYCEFEGKQTPEKMDKVMEMPGGGTFPIKPGQLTDDTEMALHCLKAIQSYDPSQKLQEQVFPLQHKIATEYISWVDSYPYDIGITCQTGIQMLRQEITNEVEVDKEQMHAQLNKAFDHIRHANSKSLSNGSLMRITPMAIMLGLVKATQPEQVSSMIQIITGQIKMTHSNKTAIESSLNWAGLLSDLAIRKDVTEIKTIFDKVSKIQDTSKEWINTGISQPLMDATKKEGFAKIAFSYGIHHLKNIAETCTSDEQLNGDLYSKVIREVIQQGGDSDTNAAIVGGMMGAIVGFRSLPANYLHKQLSLKLGYGGSYGRSSFYEPIEGLINCIRLIRKFK